MIRTALIFILCFWTTGRLFSQSEIFISNQFRDIAIVEIALNNCSQSVQVTTDVSLSDITLHPSGKMYGVNFGQRKVYEVNMNTGQTTEILQISEADKLVGLTADANGLLYATEGNVVPSDLYVIDPVAGTYVNKGPLLEGSAGDLTWSFGKLYNASDNNKLVEVNIEDPASSITIGSFNGIVKAGDRIFALVSVFTSCTETVTYGLSEFGDYYELDLQTANVTRLCIDNVDLYGATSADEFLASECFVGIDLDNDNSAGLPGNDFQAGFQCEVTSAPIADTDPELLTASRVDSVRIELKMPLPDGTAEMLQPGVGPNLNVFSSRTRISAVNAGAAGVNDFESFLTNCSYVNAAFPLTPGDRKVEVIAFSEGKSDTAEALLHIAAVDAGEDGAVQVCSGSQATLFNALGGTPLAGGTWIPALSSGTDLFNASVDVPGEYLYVATDGCATDTASVDVQIAGTDSDLISDTTVCAASITLDADVGSPGATYDWSTGATTPSIEVTVSGTYEVTVSLGGCTMTDEAIVTLNSLSLELGPDVAVCNGQTADLDAEVGIPGAVYLWSTGAVTPSITVGPGHYEVIVTAGACSTSDSVAVVLSDEAVDLGSDTTLCDAASYMLNADAGDPQAQYLWNTGATSASVTVTQSGVYGVTIDLNGCTASDSVEVTFMVAELDLGEDFTLCPGDQVLLDGDVGDPQAQYLWNTGATSPGLLVDAAGTYAVTVTIGACAYSDAVEAQLSAGGDIDFDLGSDITICQGASATISSGYSTAVYDHIWNTGSTNPAINTSSGGLYILTLSNSCQSGTDSVTVFVEDCDTVPPVDTTEVVYEPLCVLQFPSAFTPNGDGSNDVFYAAGLCPEITTYHFRIYNRYGELLFSGSDRLPWTGVYKGEPVPLDVYIWYAEWIDETGFAAMETGTIAVIR